MEAKPYDFSGYATKYGIKCSDGRTIQKDAFKHMNGMTVPFVYHHLHDDVLQVLGHALLEARDDGMYAWVSCNDTEKGQHTKSLVKHGDIVSLSIYANNLVQKGKDVVHGMIRELSLVLAGANPEAVIDNIAISHEDGSIILDEEEAVISMKEPISVEIIHEDEGTEKEQSTEENEEKNSEEDISHALSENATVQDVLSTMTEEQQNVVAALITEAINETNSAMAQSEDGGEAMKTNPFEPVRDPKTPVRSEYALTHSDFTELFDAAKRENSFKAVLKHAMNETEGVLSHADTYGLDPIEVLFPDAQLVNNTPEYLARRMEWVSTVLNGVRHSPFSRIKMVIADITADEARAKGYVKATMKKEEIIRLIQRAISPKTIYKKQKLDRDDVLDITSFDVIAWLRSEMRIMLDEEVARAILIGDGREADDPDKISEENIIPIFKDADLYAHHVVLPAIDPANPGPGLIGQIDAVLMAMAEYRGSGAPTMFVSPSTLTRYLTVKDTMMHRLYPTMAELNAAMTTSNIVTVPLMEGATRVGDDGKTYALNSIVVNLRDYTVGTDRGGQITSFDDFDIDFNQHKYLIETRMSGALTRPKSALVFETDVSPAG